MEEYVMGVIKASGIALGIVGLNAAGAFFDVGTFLSELPELLQLITYGGAALGAVDNILWSATGEGLKEMYQ